MNRPDDKTLMEKCIEGDRQAMEALITRYQKPVYNAAYRMLHSRDDAQDVTQTVFLKVFEHLDQFDPQRRFFSWIYRITLNESINWLKKSKRLEPIDETAADDSYRPDGRAGDQQLGENMQTALRSISTDYRQVVVLKQILGCSYREIAETLEIPEKTVKSRLYTARQLLRDRLVKRGITV